MISLASFIAFLAFGLAASFFDVRERRVPNYLNAGFFALALLFWFLESKSEWFFIQVALALVAGYILYKAGVWAAGDAKFFAAANAFSFLSSKQTGLGVLLEVALIMCVSGLALFAWVLVKNWRAVAQKKKQLTGIFLKTLAWSGVWNAISFIIFREFNAFLFIAATASGLVLAGVKELKELWVERISASKAQPGMIIEEVKARGKKIGGMARGLSEQEIRVLKKSGVRYLLVRSSAVFAPFISLAVVVLLWF